MSTLSQPVRCRNLYIVAIYALSQSMRCRNPCVVKICRIGVRGSIVDRVVRARSAASIVHVNRSDVSGAAMESMAMDIAES
jgi:hypothetical protein